MVLKGQSKAVNRRTNNAMDKRENTSQNPGVNSNVPEDLTKARCELKCSRRPHKSQVWTQMFQKIKQILLH